MESRIEGIPFHTIENNKKMDSLNVGMVLDSKRAKNYVDDINVGSINTIHTPVKRFHSYSFCHCF